MNAYGFSYSSLKCCQQYRNALKPLVEELDKYEDDGDATNNLLDEFSTKYLSPDFWFLRLEDVQPYNLKAPATVIIQNQSLIDKAIFHFGFDDICDKKQRHFKFTNQECFVWSNSFWSEELNALFADNLGYLIFPNNKLELYKKYIERFSTTPISKSLMEKYSKALNLYKKIIEAKNDNEKWFKLIQEWNDEEFISHNIEYRISQNIDDKNLWKLYIEYLRPRNFKAMLGLYSRYCRFFLDDFEMKKEFEQEAIKYGIHLKDDKLLDFRKFRSISSVTKFPRLQKCNTKLKLSSALTFQNFALPNPIICYLMKNTLNLQKLFLTCKYFFVKHPTPICHQLVASSKPPKFYAMHPDDENNDAMFFQKQSLKITDDTTQLKQLQNLYLTNLLYISTHDKKVHTDIFYLPPNNSKLLKTILPSIYRCAVKYLTIKHHIISLKDYYFLTKEKTVQEIKFVDVKIMHDNTEKMVQLEDVMTTLPNAYHIDLKNCPEGNKRLLKGGQTHPFEINVRTFQNLARIQRNAKISYFSICVHDRLFDYTEFFDFIKENMDQRITYDIDINKNMENQFKISLMKNVFDIKKRLQGDGLQIYGTVDGQNYFYPY